MAKSRKLWLLLQLAVTCSLFACVLANCELQAVGAIWSTVDWSWWILCALLQLVYVALGWGSLALLLGKVESIRGWTQGMIHYAAVQAFAAYTPARMGEAILPFSLKSTAARSPQIAASLLVQRIVGISLLVLLGGISFARGVELGVSSPFLVATAGLGMGAVIVLAAERWIRANPAWIPQRCEEWLHGFRTSWSDTLRKQKGRLIAHVGVMAGRFFANVAAWCCLLLSFGAPIPFENVVLLVSCLNLAAAIPISIAGVGVTDAVLALGLSTFGYGPELAVSLCLVGRGIHTITAVLWITLYSFVKVSGMTRPVAA